MMQAEPTDNPEAPRDAQCDAELAPTPADDKPSWDDAPQWANGLGIAAFDCDYKGQWCWLQCAESKYFEQIEKRPVKQPQAAAVPPLHQPNETRKCGHPLGTTRWCPDCERQDARRAS